MEIFRILNSTRVIVLLTALLFSGCQVEENLVDEFTGNEITYTLNSGSDWDFHGTATFLEKKDNSTRVIIQLEGIEGSKNFPVHLHYESYNKQADLAAQLEPLAAERGLSVTDLTELADETNVTYQDLAQFDGHIKVHLEDSGPLKDVILSYGNIGKNAPLPLDMKVAKCFGF